MIAGSAAVVGLIYGYDNGSIASAALFIRPAMGISDLGLSVIVSAISAGMLVGAFFGGRITNATGRKRAMIGVALGYMIFSALQAATFDVVSLAAVRLILGFFIGVSIVAAPAFIAESAPARTRGAMLVTFQIAETVGLAVSYLTGVALAGTHNWRLILGLAAVPCLVVLIMVRRLPDTPRWYLMKGRRDEALSVLHRTHDKNDAELEAQAIETDLSYQESGRLTELFRGNLRKAALFAMFLGFSVQITGIQAVVQYSPTILSRVGLNSEVNAIAASAMVQVIGVAAEIVSFKVVDRWGRRPTLLTGVAIMGLASATLVIAFATGPSVSLTVAGILLFTLGFNFGYGALVWVYASESLPARLRTQGASLLLTADLIGNVLVSFLFLNVAGALGESATFGIFFGLTFIALLGIYRYAPETKGRRLEDIRYYWANNARWPEHIPTEETSTETQESTETQ